MMTIFIEIGLSVWCYASKGDVPEKAAMLFGEKFKEAQNDPSKVRWWDNIQSEVRVSIFFSSLLIFQVSSIFSCTENKTN